MERRSIINKANNFNSIFSNRDYRYAHFESYFLPRLQNRVYQSRAEAYKAIDKFIEDFNKEKYFAGIKGILKPSMFTVEDAPKYRIEGFESNDDYLDYIAYTG